MDQAIRDITPLMQSHDARDLEEIHAIKDRLLRFDDVQAVEILDESGHPVSAGSHRENLDKSPLRLSRELPPALPKHAGAPLATRNGGMVTLHCSRTAAREAMVKLREDVSESQRTHFQDLVSLLGLASAVLLVIGLVTAWLLARRIERPITALIRSADRIGQGDYT